MFYKFFFLSISTISFTYSSPEIHFCCQWLLRQYHAKLIFCSSYLCMNFFAIFVPEFCAITTYCFRNEKQHSVCLEYIAVRVKLNVLYIRNFYRELWWTKAIPSPVAIFDLCVFINVTGSSSCYHGYFAVIFFDFYFLVRNIRSITRNIF